MQEPELMPKGLLLEAIVAACYEFRGLCEAGVAFIFGANPGRVFLGVGVVWDPTCRNQVWR